MKMDNKISKVNKIKISNFDILSLDLNQGWEITDIEYDECCPPNMIDELVITVRKSRRNKLIDNENIKIEKER